MADILIRGMEMPKENEILVFDVWHGKMYARSTANTGARRYEVVSLPEGHGRCIDADEISDSLSESATFNYNKRTSVCWSDAFLSMIDMLDDAPTIVPAEGGTGNG